MKFILPALFVLSIVLVSCSARTYIYKIEMTKPVQSQKLEYENDTFHIAFDVQPKWIEFQIYNKSEDGIKISWDEVSFSVNGKSYRVVHKETGTFKITEVQPPTTIPPKSNLTDQLIPSSNITYGTSVSTTQKFVNIKELFPSNDYGNKAVKATVNELKGARITIFLPFYVRGQYVSKYYDLLIKDVIPKK